jgi:RNA polymerase sigma-70 factor (ECF subfamily)
MDQVARKQAAFAEALGSELRGIYSYFRRLGVEAASAEDLTQDTFVSAWQHLPSLRDARKLRGWLYRIAHRRYLKHRDAAAKRATTELSQALAAAPADDPGSDERTHLRAVRHVLHQLPEPYLHPLILIYWEDLSYQEAAHALSLPLGTFSWRVHKALRLLRRALAEEGIGDEATQTSKASRPADSVSEG